AVALTSGTAAIHMALILAEVKSGDEVFCSTLTFAGSAFPISYCGATPVFVDSDTKTWNMDPDLLEKAIKERIKIGKKPKACILVHLYGNCADVEEVTEICKKYDISVIEDAAESLGTIYKSRHTGTFSDLGVYSFNGNKIITTGGGGMLVGKKSEDIDKARFLSTQARDHYPYYHHSVLGYNYRMSNVLAAIGLGQLEVIEEKIRKKQKIRNWYKEYLTGFPEIEFIPENKLERSNCWLTCIIVDDKRTEVTTEELRIALERNNIESRPIWNPMHLQPIYKSAPAYINGVSENLFRTGICLPSGTDLTSKDVERICDCIVSALYRRR
ncbi:MAG: aminotransferase class V-fold PLP-dependent enzyme, partial [Chitinispirillaceae bacterium]